MYDWVIRGATVLDGSGAPRFTADVGVTDGRIAEIGKISQSGREEVDAGGLMLAPGFIDVHTHYDERLFGARPTPGYPKRSDRGASPSRPGCHDVGCI